MAKSFRDATLEDLRLVIMRLLAESVQYTCNAYVLHGMLPAHGHSESLDAVRAQLHWLQEQGCVQLVDDAPILVATLTQRGMDVSAGRATMPGVQRPHPV